MGHDVPKVFDKVSKQGARYFEREAKKITTEKRLVDTGNYRNSWHAKAVDLGGAYAVHCENTAEYASYLEYGHRLKDGNKTNGNFVGEQAVGNTRYKLYELLEKEMGKIL